MDASEDADVNVREQAIAAQVSEMNSERFASLYESLNAQDNAFIKALAEFDATRDFISRPQNILGSDLTKHGEVAEHMEVGWRRAWDFLHQEMPNATFDGVHRTAPEDYRIDGIDVQSKFLNGSRNTLNAITEHINKYPDWKYEGRFFHIAKDQHEQIQNALAGGNPDGLSEKTVEGLRVKSTVIEELSGGRDFDDVVRPSRYEYREVQLGRVKQTLDADKRELSHEKSLLKDEIQAKHEPSVAEGLESAAYGAGIAAGIAFVYGVYLKAKDGKSIYEFSLEDWEELGLKSGESGIGGAVAGGSIYALTNFADFSAPFAGACVSTTRATITQIQLFNNGKITKGELVDNSFAIATEAGICGACVVIGQAVIPVPVLGAIAGSISGRFLSGIYKKTLGEQSQELVKELDRRFDEALMKIDRRYQTFIREVMAELDQLDDLIQFAFSPQNNLRLMELSIVTARRLGVPEEQIIMDHDQLDRLIHGN